MGTTGSWTTEAPRWLRSRRRFDVTCSLLAVTAVLVGSAATFIVLRSGQATEVGLEEVLTDYRAGTTTTGVVAELVPATSPPAVDEGAVPAAAPPPEAVPVLSGDAVTDGAVVQDGAPVTAAPDPASGRPTEGVYRYATTGGESISLAGGSRSYPSEVYATVRHTPCGHQIEVRVIEEHVDRTDVCSNDGLLSLASEFKEISFFGQTDSGAIVCDPPMPLVSAVQVPGSSRRHDCTAGSVRTEGTVTYTGVEEFAIDGGTVVGRRVEWRWTSSGQSTGSGVTTWLFDDGGLPLRIERVNENVSETVLGRVRYEESASFELRSRTALR